MILSRRTLPQSERAVKSECRCEPRSPCQFWRPTAGYYATMPAGAIGRPRWQVLTCSRSHVPERARTIGKTEIWLLSHCLAGAIGRPRWQVLTFSRSNVSTRSRSWCSVALCHFSLRVVYFFCIASACLWLMRCISNGRRKSPPRKRGACPQRTRGSICSFARMDSRACPRAKRGFAGMTGAQPSALTPSASVMH
jgi:hypothetical protein